MNLINPKLSIITPTIRKDGLDVIYKSLLNQTFKDWEWLVGSKFDPGISEATWIKDDFTGGYWSLNRIYNKLINASKGNLIISWQDWVWVPPDGLEKFVIVNKAHPNSVISGVGDQYERLNQFGKPEVKIWSDPRKNLNNGSFYECYPNDCEWNWCLIPKDLLYKIGGMDEELDNLGYGGDQLQVGERLDALKVKFYLDQTNESFTVRHSREDFGGEEKWNAAHVLFAQDNGMTIYDRHKLELIKRGRWPKLDFLK